MAWTLTQAHEEQRTQAAQVAANVRTVALADAGAGPSTLQIYDAATDLLATITLAKPCGVIVDGKIQLQQASATGDVVLITGVPTYAQWLDGDGQLLASCSVSAAGGGGDLTISSRTDGQVFAGGFITLAEGLIG